MKRLHIITLCLLLFSLFTNVNAASFVPEDNEWFAGGFLDGDLTLGNHQIAYESTSIESTLTFFSSDYSRIGSGYLNSFDTSKSGIYSLAFFDLNGLVSTLYGSIQEKFSYAGTLLAFGGIKSTGEVNQALVSTAYGKNFGLFAGKFDDNVQISATPIPAAVWLFGSGIAALLGFSNRKKKSLSAV